MTMKDLIKKDRGLSTRTESNDAFTQLHREMNRLFDDFFTDFSLTPAWGSLTEPVAHFTPKVNVSETDNDYLIMAELPGMEQKDVSVEVRKDMVVISGERKDKTEDKSKRWHRIELSYGAFERDIALPSGADPESAKATFKNGILSISMPKLKEATEERKHIEITAE